MATLTAGDWAQIGSAVFTALAAFAALATVIRVERDRRDRALPDLHIDYLHDLQNDEVRMTVVNYGGPAREVTIAGVHGTFGWFGLVGPTTYWRPGESRTVVLSMPTDRNAGETLTLVLGRDVRMRYLFARTVGGANKRWAVSRSEVSSADVFHHFFPDSPGPLDVPHTPIKMTTTERVL